MHRKLVVSKNRISEYKGLVSKKEKVENRQTTAPIFLDLLKEVLRGFGTSAERKQPLKPTHSPSYFLPADGF